MAAMRVPLWLKLGWTVWVIAWVPFYWTQYGLQNFLFFCDLWNLFLMLALWLESPLIFSWQATGLLLFQTLYAIDLAGAFSTGSHIVGGTEYMFDPNDTFIHSPARPFAGMQLFGDFFQSKQSGGIGGRPVAKAQDHDRRQLVQVFGDDGDLVRRTEQERAVDAEDSDVVGDVFVLENMHATIRKQAWLLKKGRLGAGVGGMWVPQWGRVSCEGWKLSRHGERWPWHLAEEADQSLDVLCRSRHEELLVNKLHPAQRRRPSPIWFLSSANSASTFFLSPCALTKPGVLTKSLARCRPGSCMWMARYFNGARVHSAFCEHAPQRLRVPM
jgi:hypothetical protein